MSDAAEASVASRSAVELGTAFRRHELSPVEVTEAILHRIDELDGVLHAFAHVDRAGALAAASEAERRYRRGEPLGPLDGVPVSVKDLLFVRGMPTAAGSPALADLEPDVEEVSVERLRAAGAVILGKTAVPELGFGPGTQSPLVGVSRNPWDVARTPGGSSGGAAAAVAVGLGPVALGTDAGGSIRAPAAFCGVLGLKPSFGRVPMHPAARDDAYPAFSGFETFDVVGPLTRTVADAALVLDVIAGHDPRDRHSIPSSPGGFGIDVEALDLTGLRVDWTLDLGAGMPVDREVAAAVAAAAARFADLGARVDPVAIDLGDTRPTFAPLAALELGALRRWAAGRPDVVNARVRRLLDETWTFDEVSAAFAARKVLHDTVARLFETVDVILTPTTPVPAYPVTEELPTLAGGALARAYDLSVYTAPFTLTGHPAASVPCGWTTTGLPIGMQVVAGHRADRLVLRAAAAFEAVAPWRHRQPPTLAP